MAQGYPHAPEKLFQLLYDELPRLAAQKVAPEGPGQTLQDPGNSRATPAGVKPRRGLMTIAIVLADDHPVVAALLLF
jgi:hypothetical protein